MTKDKPSGADGAFTGMAKQSHYFGGSSVQGAYLVGMPAPATEQRFIRRPKFISRIVRPEIPRWEISVDNSSWLTEHNLPTRKLTVLLKGKPGHLLAHNAR
jgi:hypothetical protein